MVFTPDEFKEIMKKNVTRWGETSATLNYDRLIQISIANIRVALLMMLSIYEKNDNELEGYIELKQSLLESVDCMFHSLYLDMKKEKRSKNEK